MLEVYNCTAHSVTQNLKSSTFSINTTSCDKWKIHLCSGQKAS